MDVVEGARRGGGENEFAGNVGGGRDEKGAREEGN